MKHMMIALLLVLGFSVSAQAGTLGQVREATCSSQQGSFLRLNRASNILEGKIARIPFVTNIADHSRMPIDFLPEQDGYVSLVALTVNFKTNTMGSLALFAKANENLRRQARLLAVFRTMQGGVQTEVLNCVLLF
jgi:hypothetical protein